MPINELSDVILKKFDRNLFEKSQEFPTNKINIILIKEKPLLKIRSIILDNDREFHLIINQKKLEIFHDCPSFLIHSSKEEKICIHFIKLLLIIKEDIALQFLRDFDRYALTSEDVGSAKKSKNFSILANNCFETNNCIEGLSYLNKAIINQCECESIIEKYFEMSIKNNLFIEFFEFLKSGYDNDLEDHFFKFKNYIEKGFRRFLSSVPDYNFFDLLRTLKSMDRIFEIKDLSFLASLTGKLKEMINSSDFNNRYFSIYFVKRHIEKLIQFNEGFNDLFSQNQLKSLREDSISYFLAEIDNFCIIDKLKLLKKQFEILEIPEKSYINEYRNYKSEIKGLEKKVYLKKFAFLRLLIEKYNIKIAKVGFRKKRNTYLVNHDTENLSNPVYNYIISHLGFFGLNLQTIKSSEIGINFFIINELFHDDLSSFADIFYYRKQFWGELEEFRINSIDGFSLFSKTLDYSYDIDQKYSNINDVMIIEWDLANKPIQGSIVTAYGSQIIIPDHNNPLFHDLKPFDLCYCKKSPVKIEGSLIKTINVISKCSFKDAINSVSKGMDFIEGFYPLSLIRELLSKKISPFTADDMVFNNPNKVYVQNYNKFIKAFREFLFNFINREKNYVFESLKSNMEEKTKQIISLINLTNELAGLDLPYPELIKKNLTSTINLKEFKSKFLMEIHDFIKIILKTREIGNTIIFNIKKLKNTPFFKYSKEILDIREVEFESTKVYNYEGIYDLSALRNTYYGKKFVNILNIGLKPTVKPDIFVKISAYAKKLNLKLNIVKTQIT